MVGRGGNRCCALSVQMNPESQRIIIPPKQAHSEAFASVTAVSECSKRGNVVVFDGEFHSDYAAMRFSVGLESGFDL